MRVGRVYFIQIELWWRMERQLRAVLQPYLRDRISTGFTRATNPAALAEEQLTQHVEHVLKVAAQQEARLAHSPWRVYS